MADWNLTTQADAPEVGQVERSAAWLLVTCDELRGAAWRELPHGELLRARGRRRGASAANGLLVTDLPNARGTRVVQLTLKRGLSAYERLSAARRAAAEILQCKAREVVVSSAGFAATETAAVLEAMVAALLAQLASLPSRKREAVTAPRLKRIRVCGVSGDWDALRPQAEAAGNALARALSILPANELTPGSYRERVKLMAHQHGWRYDFLDHAALARRKAGAFLAVVQGSDQSDAGILHLRYQPPRTRGRAALALVGKGICFDTGGVNLKSAKHMLGMHEDMQGSAVALGTLLALTELEVEFPIDCWLALAQNQIGPRAYKPNDVVYALDGTSIEIIHTDAEGRMVLADTLTLASQRKPGLIIDYATLTGSCIDALGKNYSGVFTNRDALHGVLIEAGRASGERVWPFPQDEDYDRALDSTIADIRQCAADNEADHILAARFLRRFVKHGVPWVHLDLSACSVKGGLAHIPTDTTGFGVRYSLNLLLEQKVMEHLG